MTSTRTKLRATYLTVILLFSALTMPIAVVPAGAAGNVSVGSGAYTYADLSQVGPGTPQVVATSVSAFGGTNAGNTGDLLVDTTVEQGLITTELWYDADSDGTVDDSDTQNLTVGGWDRTTQFNVTVTMQHFPPYMLQFYGNLTDVSGWNTSYDPASGNVTATVTVSPIEVDKMQSPTSFDGNKQAETNFEAIVRFSFNSLEGLSPQQKASLNGSVQLTNSQNLTAPTYHPPGTTGGPQLVYEAAAPAQETDGSDNQGFFETYLSERLLESWGDPSVSQLQSVSGGALSISETSFTRVLQNGNRNGVLVNISHTYSSGTVGVETAPAYINGTVSDTSGSEAGAPVTLEYAGPANLFVASTLTDSNGDYSFEVPDPTRDYEVIVDTQAHPLSTTTNLSATSGATTTNDVTLQDGGFITGTVTAGGDPVSGVRVLFINSSRNTFNRSVTTDASGEYNASLRSPGRYDVIVDNSSYELELVPKTSVQTGQDTTVDLTLSEAPGTGTITGTVEDTNGNPIQNAAVFAAESSYTDFGQNTTNSSGGFSIDVRQGTYTVRVSASGYPPTLAQNVNVTENQSTSLTVTLEEPGYINGTLTPPAGASTGGASVLVETGEGAIPGSVDPTTGDYNVTVPPGDHTVTVMARNGTAPSKQVSVSAGAVNETDFRLRNTTIVDQSVEILEGPGRPANLEMRSMLLGGLLHVQLFDNGNASIPKGQVTAPKELEQLGITDDTQIRMNITIRNFTANSMLWGLNSARWSTSENTTVRNGTDITITGSPTTMQANTQRNLGPLITKDPSEVQWSTGRDDRATVGFNQTVFIALFNLGNVPAELRNALNGMSVTTNAQTFSIPSVNNNELQVWVAAPTKTVEGVDHSGFYQAEIPQSQLDTWGVDDPETELDALYKGSAADFSVTDTTDGARIRIDNISYSAGYVEVQANPSSPDDGSSPGGGAGGDDESTPAATPAPSTEAPAETAAPSTPASGQSSSATPPAPTATPESTPRSTETPNAPMTDAPGQPGFGFLLVLLSLLLSAILAATRSSRSVK